MFCCVATSESASLTSPFYEPRTYEARHPSVDLATSWSAWWPHPRRHLVCSGARQARRPWHCRRARSASHPGLQGRATTQPPR
jgi:hypothetical protein